MVFAFAKWDLPPNFRSTFKQGVVQPRRRLLVWRAVLLAHHEE